jgi:SlyX protein
LAHLSKTCEEISDVVAMQQIQIDRLNRFIEKLAEREVEHDRQGVEENLDKPPPHW